MDNTLHLLRFTLSRKVQEGYVKIHIKELLDTSERTKVACGGEHVASFMISFRFATYTNLMYNVVCVVSCVVCLVPRAACRVSDVVCRVYCVV